MNDPASDAPAGLSRPPLRELLLEARQLRKTYIIGRRTLEVLRDVSLTVAPGAFLALRGASGAGKSTLLHLLGGLDAPNSGRDLVRRPTTGGDVGPRPSPLA